MESLNDGSVSLPGGFFKNPAGIRVALKVIQFFQFASFFLVNCKFLCNFSEVLRHVCNYLQNVSNFVNYVCNYAKNISKSLYLARNYVIP